MGKKIRFIRTTVVEFEPNPEYYPEGSTIEDMAKTDLENVKENGDFEALFTEVVSDDIVYEIID